MLAILHQGGLQGFQHPVRLHLLFAQATCLHVLAGMVHGGLEHGLDLGIGESIGGLHLDATLHPAALFPRRDAQHAVSVHLVGDADARRASHHGRDPAQFEARQGAAVAHQLALALHHVQGHGALAVLEGGEFLGARHRDGGVARDDLLHQPTHGLDAQGQGNHVQQ